jgi:hypothetical protein
MNLIILQLLCEQYLSLLPTCVTLFVHWVHLRILSQTLYLLSHGPLTVAWHLPPSGNL